MSIAFLVTALVVIVTPGPGVVYTLSTGLTHGGRAGVVAAAGCTLGLVPHIAATIVGLAALLRTGTVAFQVLKVAGAVYLLHLAWATLTDARPVVVAGEDAPRPAARTVVSGVLSGVFNPKPTIFFVAFLPQFVPGGQADPLTRMVLLSAVFMLLTFVVFAAYGIFAGSVRRYVIARPRVLAWLRRAFAGSFAALAAALVLTGR
ncbi:LysE family translocator [Planosporangium sp. 12N6]|uniref:LysE family translocator n=1 Tax=Planosporangium spinosum TaxID=3402278 RepID=UPI003CFA62F1